MGKGDIKTRRGKIFNGSFGKTRPRNKKASVAAPATSVVVEKPKPVKAKTTKKK